ESYALYEAPSELVPLYAVPSPDTYDPGMPPESYSLYAAPDDPEGLESADPGAVAVPAYAAPTPELLTPGDVVAMYAAPVPEPLLEEDPEDEVAD
ncbi:MAG: hypothetical protein RBU37_28485, partial [Myxococcota bacterium]|nr:hypothetical protein [Myxococcota bacterium]